MVYFWKENRLICFLNKKYINRGLRIIGLNIYRFPQIVYLKESRYRFNCKMNCLDLKGKNVYVDGYWQCPLYFEREYSKFIKLFSLRNIENHIYKMGEKLKNSNSLAIHVRRGDYPKRKKIGVRLLAIGDEYYKVSVSDFLKKNPDCKIYLFSNDTKEALSLISKITDKQIIILSDKISLSSLDEWYLMSCCQNQIIGNSTFSWWAAYLNKNKEKLVYAPNVYWGNDDILPKEWNQVSVF